jgi:hypothetical protein
MADLAERIENLSPVRRELLQRLSSKQSSRQTALDSALQQVDLGVGRSKPFSA